MLDILLIDDEPELLEITFEELILNYKNLNIVKATSGNDGINLLMNGQVFDFIISDYNMPNGTGVDLLKYKTALDYPGYFILYTNHLKPELPKNLNDSFLGVIEKLKFDDLFSCVTSCIEKSAKLKNKLRSF